MRQHAAAEPAHHASPRRGPFFPLRRRSAAAGAAPPFFQAKLQVGTPGDRFEQEADRVADQVVAQGAAPPLQAKCAGCAEEGERELRRQPLEEEEEEETLVPAAAAPELRREPLAGGGSATAGDGPGLSGRLRDARGGGRPLPAPALREMASAFGRDLSGVRVHTGEPAAQLSEDLGAAAFTHGRDVFFNRGRFDPASGPGRRLLAHELTHVVQQTGGGSPRVRLAAEPRIARTPLDLERLDRELFWGDRLTQTSGGIGFGAARGPAQDPPSEDRSAGMEIEAEVFPRNTASTRGLPSGAGGPAAPASGTGGAPGAGGDGGEETEGPPHPTPRRVVGSGDRSHWGFEPSGLLVPARRALVVAGIHGDERGPLDLMAELRTELASGTAPLARDFDTVVIPVMNPGGVADRTRTNRRGVDLNRNFPGLQGFPAPAGPVPPRQPEVTAVMDVVDKLAPERILAMHAISTASSGGAFADPVEGPARELACRMALRMRGTPLPGGGMSGDVNVPANEVAAGVCSARYPEAASVSVTTAQSSLGAWASASKAIGGAGSIPIVTHEVAGKSPLAATGAGRSVATILPGIREFLLDNERQPSEADELLRRAVTDAFLTGEGTTRAETGLRDAIVRTVNARFLDMNAHYRQVWRPARPVAARRLLPASLTNRSHFRSFGTQAGITRGALAGQALFSASSTDPEIAQAIRNVMQTISLPGFSRHPWGTEIDVIDATRGRWTGSGDLTPVIPFLQAEAGKFGFFHPYTLSPPDAALPHYEDEPWHLSYWPIANVLQRQWESRITGQVLRSLIARTAAAIGGRVPAARLEGILGGMGLEHFQSNVAGSP